MRPLWQQADTEGDLLVHMAKGIYYGCSQSTFNNTLGRLFSTDLRGQPAQYYLIAWNEL